MATEPGKELLWKYAFGQCEAHEIAFVESWLKLDPENQKTLDRIRMYESMNEAKQGSLFEDKKAFEEIDEEKPYKGYFYAFILLILVFILLGIYKCMKS